MMARTQVSLEPELQRRARDRAAQLGISFAEYVRRLVDEDLREPKQPVSPTLVLSLGRSGGSNIAREKDGAIASAIEAHRRRSREAP
jgi:hypothetical protein